MAQITGVGFSNFRVFEKDTFFDLAPISIFTGTNSSGKSSVFKGLQLLSENKKDLRFLDFSSDNHKLGTFANILNYNSDNSQVRFKIKIADFSRKSIFNEAVFEFNFLQDPVNNEGGSLKSSKIVVNSIANQESIVLFATKEIESENDGERFDVASLNFKYIFNELFKSKIPLAKEYFEELFLEIEKTGGSGSLVPDDVNSFLDEFIHYDGNIIDRDKIEKLLSSFSKESINHLIGPLEEFIIERLSLVLFQKIKGFRRYNDVREEAKNYLDFIRACVDVLKGNETAITNEILIKPVFEVLDPEIFSNYLPYLNVGFNEIVSEKFFPFCRKIVGYELKYLTDNFSYHLDNIYSIEAVRANSQRLYTNQSQGTSFNKLLLEIGQGWEKLQETNKEGFSALGFIEKWLERFQIGNTLKINRIKGIASEVFIEKNGNRNDLVDLGFGVTQLLPILLYLPLKLSLKDKKGGNDFFYGFEDLKGEIFLKEKPLLLIEEPESNLHPKLQSLLADFFIDVAKNYEVTLLIETHSEYLIRRLQVLTASGKAKPEDSVIYYLNGENRAEGEKQVTKININPDGSLTNDFGPGFIDEATNWKLELMRLKNAKLHEVNLN